VRLEQIEAIFIDEKAIYEKLIRFKDKKLLEDDVLVRFCPQ
jgi:hypothetical protein